MCATMNAILNSYFRDSGTEETMPRCNRETDRLQTKREGRASARVIDDVVFRVRRMNMRHGHAQSDWTKVSRCDTGAPKKCSEGCSRREGPRAVVRAACKLYGANGTARAHGGATWNTLSRKPVSQA